MPGYRGVTEAEIGQTARRPALSPFSEMALFEKMPLWGWGRAGRLREEGGSVSGKESRWPSE